MSFRKVSKNEKVKNNKFYKTKRAYFCFFAFSCFPTQSPGMLSSSYAAYR